MDGEESPVEPSRGWVLYGVGLRGLDSFSAFFLPKICSNADRLVVRVQELRLAKHHKCQDDRFIRFKAPFGAGSFRYQRFHL
jgi:hypothetical protein